MKLGKFSNWSLVLLLGTLGTPAWAQESDGQTDQVVTAQTTSENQKEELKSQLKEELLAELKAQLKEELKAEIAAEEAARKEEEAAMEKVAADGASDVMAATKPAPQEEESLAKRLAEGFTFGSYGRVPIGSNLNGSLGKQVALVSHAPRITESPYAEIDLGYTFTIKDGPTFRPHFTLALNENLFHLSGNWQSGLAVRNLYLEINDVFAKGLSFWGGSRMYRGDDIYLLDFWPLDEQNTVGGGVRYNWGASEVKVHIGLNRLNNEFQLQEIPVGTDTVGANTISFMDRSRFVMTARGEHIFNLSDKLRLKGVLYAEYHYLPQDNYLTDAYTLRDLPEDHGFVVGGELSLYQDGTANHLNLYVKYGWGLGAYDEMEIPTGLNVEKQAQGADDLTIGLAGNYEFGSKAGLMIGYYIRNFTDADPVVYDVDDYTEMAFAIRPAFYLAKYFQLIAELNFQYKRPNGLNPENGLHDQPFAFTAAIMPTASLGTGSYARPQLRLVYAITVLNDAAMRTYDEMDIRRDQRVQHWLGINCEWWFNSSRH